MGQREQNSSKPRRVWPLALAALLCVLVWQVMGQVTIVSLAPKGAVPPARMRDYPALGNVDAAVAGLPVRPGGDAGASVDAGTPGRSLAAAGNRAELTFAILGDCAGGRETGMKYLSSAVDELNLLRPAVVLNVGDMVDGYARTAEDYGRQAAEYQKVVDRLAMPWYPTAGVHDVLSGTLDPADKRFEALYQKCFGPLYYSLNMGDAHFVMLYTEERTDADPVLSDAQLTWLKNDLAKTFDARRARHVFVLMHRPMWRYPQSNWGHVAALLLEFNRRPLVAIEGAGGAGSVSQAKVEAVFAGHLHAYTQDPVKDGIAYYVLGPTGGAIDQDRYSGQMQSYVLVHVDEGAGGGGAGAAGAAASNLHIAVIEPGSIHGDDFVTAADRAIAQKISEFGAATMGVEGLLDQPLGKASGSRDADSRILTLIMENPLDVPIDVAVRMASGRNFTSVAQRESAAALNDNLDSPWELHAPYQSKHLMPGDQKNYSMALYCAAQGGEVAPPQVEFVVSFLDSKGRTVSTVLKRKIGLIPSITVPQTAAGKMPSDADWEDAPRRGTYAYVSSAYDTTDPPPEFAMLADATNVYLKVHVDDRRFSYWPNFKDPTNLPSDAVAVAFAPAATAGNAQTQRIVAFPFAPDGPLLLTNNGVGKDQTALLPLDVAAHPVVASVARDQESYELTLTIPRKTLLTATGEAVMNVTVFNNDETGHTTVRGWAQETAGPRGWGRVKIEAK